MKIREGNSYEEHPPEVQQRKKNINKEEGTLQYLFFAFDFDADVKANSSWHSWFIGSFLQIVPDVHFTRKCPHLLVYLAVVITN